MNNTMLSKFLTTIDSDIYGFKSVDLNARYAIIDSYSNDELKDLSKEFSLNVSELRAALKKAAKDLDKKDDTEKVHKKNSHIRHSDNKEDDKEPTHNKVHKVHKASEHDKKKVRRIIKNPKPITHTERRGHLDGKNPPPPPPPPPVLPPLTIDDVTIIATYKYKK